jgi:UDP-N-acetylmuramoyl-L-alanyl-D-glutamate--2,6-diaminopimelate ligase
MERLKDTGGINVIIDYAHTPDSLENALRTLRTVYGGKLITVFGCGGDRDRDKRSEMGRVACEYSDFVFITSDNPRTENPGKIIQDILKGVNSAKNNYEIIENRPKAIQRAMDIAKKDDIIVLAGKGHETYQEICGVKHHLDEREVVAAYLKEKNG